MATILRVALVVLVLLVPIGAAGGASAQNAASATSRDGSRDFNFLAGTWKTHYRLLKTRLANSHDWYDCYGTSKVTQFWSGSGEIEEGDLKCPGSHIVGVTIRVYNAQTHQWSLWWGTQKRGIVPPPQVGHFENGVGNFYARDKHNGKPIIVRFQWTLKHGSPYFAQAFSPDNGKTWETNWTTVYTRAP